MDMTREKILKALTVQAEKEGETDNIKILRQVVGALKTSSQWQALVNVKFERYGVPSYACHRFYYAKPELLKIMAING